jgi:hypothetical protein
MTAREVTGRGQAGRLPASRRDGGVPIDEVTVTIRIVVTDPPPGVLFRVQRGRDELLEPSRETKGSIAFDVPLRAQPAAAGVRLLGPYAQGPPAARFIYVNSGRHAGQADTFWDRRAKIPLGALTWKLIESALAKTGSVLETEVYGRMGDGGPVCASVKQMKPWRIVPG